MRVILQENEKKWDYTKKKVGKPMNLGKISKDIRIDLIKIIKIVWNKFLKLLKKFFVWKYLSIVIC